MTSVSVSEVNLTPLASRRSRREAALSMMPLWTTLIRPSSLLCGWAFSSVAGPWVAHRVCPMPILPADPAENLGAPRAQDRDPGRVVSPVLQPGQALDQDGRGVLVADVADDSAHTGLLPMLSCR
jgi:hypothetical protein